MKRPFYAMIEESLNKKIEEEAQKRNMNKNQVAEYIFASYFDCTDLFDWKKILIDDLTLKIEKNEFLKNYLQDKNKHGGQYFEDTDCFRNSIIWVSSKYESSLTYEIELTKYECHIQAVINGVAKKNVDLLFGAYNKLKLLNKGFEFQNFSRRMFIRWGYGRRINSIKDISPDEVMSLYYILVESIESYISELINSGN